MEHLATPSTGSKGNNGNRIVTPRSRRKSPGDTLGSGKSQIPITRYYSSVGSSSEISSQPQSTSKRRASPGSPTPKKRLRSKVAVQGPVIISSEDSSDDLFTDPRRIPKPPAVPPLSRLDLVKRCLYPETSLLNPSGNSSSRLKKKRLSKPKRKPVRQKTGFLSSEDSSEEVPYTPINPKPSQHLRQPSSQMAAQRNQCPDRKQVQRKTRFLSSEDSSEEVSNTPTDPEPSQDPCQPSSQMGTQRNQCPNMLSQSVIISSSEDSDFELHNSKQSQSFASQSFSKDISQLSQGFLSCQAIRNSRNGSYFVGPIITPKFQPKRRSTVRNSDSTPKYNTKKYAPSLQSVSFPCAKSQDASLTVSHLDETIDSHCEEYRSSLGQKTEFESAENNSITPVKNGHSSIYLQDTLPASHDEANFQSPDIFEKFSPNTSSCSLPESDSSRQSAQKAVNTPRAHQPRPRGPSIYDQETVDPAFNSMITKEVGQTVDVSLQHSANGLAKILENASLLGSRKGGVIECSDDDLDESALTCDQSDVGSKPNRTSLRFISLSKLIDISHISGTDDELPDESCLDSECSAIEPSIGKFPRSPESLSPRTESFLVENSDDSSAGITPILNAVLDVSADFFSDVVSSFGTGGSGEEQERQGKDMQADGTGVSECVDRSVDPVSNGSVQAQRVEQQDSALDCGSTESLDTQSMAEEPGHQKQAMNSPAPCVPVPKDCLPAADDASAFQRRNCSGVDDVNPVDDTPSTIIADEPLGGSYEGSQPNELAPEKTADPEQLQICYQNQSASSKSGTSLDDKAVEFSSSLDGNPEGFPSTVDGNPAGFRSSLHDDPAGFGSILVPRPADVGSCSNAVPAKVGSVNVPSAEVPSTIYSDIPNEIKIVCGSLPPETSPKLLIAQNLDKTLLHNPKRPLLLDTILSECQNYAESILNLEPIKTFFSRYSCLPPSSKSALHGCLLELLEYSDRWLKYSEASAGSIDDVVSSGILEYLNTNDNLIAKLNSLTFYELNDIFSKLEALSGPTSEPIESLRNKIFIKLTSISSNDSCAKKEIFYLINRKFIKLTESASFCFQICLELFALPLNLNDKLYKTADIARFANSLLREQIFSKFSSLPLKLTKISVNPSKVLGELSDLCRLKSKVFNSNLNDEMIYYLVNDICSTIAVLDVSAETDPVVRNSPTFRFLVTNYVHALDEQLKKLFYVNCSDIEFGACIYLGFLLKQDVTGFQHKVKWCRERMRYLLKLLDARNIFEEFSKTLKEPVPPVESIVRAEFVLNALKIKKLGLTPDEKSHLTKLLRPTVHSRTKIVLTPLDGSLRYYDVLTKKPKMKNFELVRANIFEKFKPDFPSGIEDNGGLLINAVFLTFWQTIYLPLDGAFVNKLQKIPLDWGSEQFFSKRETIITNLVSEMTKLGPPAVLKLVKLVFEKYSSHRSVVDWNLVGPNLERINSLVETLSSDRFLKIAVHLLGKLDERSLGFPEMVLWNPESKRVKFLGLKKPSDPLYPYQILWLEKLLDFGAEAEELQISGYIGQEQCSQLK